MALYQTALTTLRNVVEQNILDEVLQNRDKINFKVQEIVDEVTESWGIVIERVDVKDVEGGRSLAEKANPPDQSDCRIGNFN